MKSHRDLDVWKKSIRFVTNIYELTKPFPDEEKYGLVSQMRRSAVSIPSNIAEGAARQNKKEFRRFLFISLASLAELETQLIIAENLNYMINSEAIDKQTNDIRKMLLGLIKYLESKI